MAFSLGRWEFRVFWEWSRFQYVEMIDSETDDRILIALYVGPLVIARHFYPVD